MKVQTYKLFTKVWSAYCKTLQRDVIQRGKAVVCPILGIFSIQKNQYKEDDED